MKTKLVKTFSVFILLILIFSTITIKVNQKLGFTRKDKIKTLDKTEMIITKKEGDTQKVVQKSVDLPQKVAQKNVVKTSDYSPKTVQNKANTSSYNTDEIVHRYCKTYGVEPHLVKAIIHVESKGKHEVKSSSGAIGIMQLTPSTAKSLGVNPYSKEDNIHGGIKYISYLHKKFDGDIVKIIASYNAGEGAVKKYNGVPPYKETHKYVKSVLQKREEYKNVKSQEGETI